MYFLAAIMSGIYLHKIAVVAAEKETEKAIDEYERAVRKNPLFLDASNNPLKHSDSKAGYPEYP